MGSIDLFRQPKQRKLMLSAGLSWLFDAMDVGLLSFVVADLAKKWSLSSSQVGVLTSINAIGMVFGAALAGTLADRFGRKAILLWTLVIFSVASGLSALAATFAVLCLLRFIVGFGLGGELPVASTLVSESVPVKDRGRAVVLLESFWAVGWIAAALVAYFVIPKYGWQAAFIIGALPALYAIYLRRAIEDSPQYLIRKPETRLPFGERFAQIWSREAWRSSAMLWILWFTVVFSYYGMFLWLPTVIAAKGYSMVRSFEYVLIMTLAQLPGYFTAAYFIEKLGRKFVLVIYLVMTAFSALWFGLAETEASLLSAGICLSFFNLGAWGAMYAYSPELYPTKLRTTGVGMATSFGRIGGVIGPLLVGYMREQDVPIAAIFTMFFITVLAGAAAVLFLGKETKGLVIKD
ncbi:MFS transporter [Paenibacillus caui]|uniref:MFS transporter n=1 Tax=Paenibacillus caui TaxID=2873927 RepID=UPI001CA9C45C|nr:MFS transporter [Paenibacillus caui]